MPNNRRSPEKDIETTPYTNYERLAIIWESNLKGTEKLILLYINECCDDYGFSWPGLDKISKRCGLSKSTVCRNLNQLETFEVLLRCPVYRTNGSQTSNDFYVNFDCLKSNFRDIEEESSPLPPPPPPIVSPETKTKASTENLLGIHSSKKLYVPTASTIMETGKLLTNSRGIRQDYFQLWFVLYRKALIQIGRSAERESIVYNTWIDKFPNPLPLRHIEGNVKPIFAAANPELLEPIEVYVERVRAACGDDTADFILGDHWHQIRIHHSGLTAKQDRKEFEQKIGLDLGAPICGVKGMVNYLQSTDAESSLEWVKTIQERSASKDNLHQFFDN